MRCPSDKEDALLDIRREEQEVHDLGDTGAGDVTAAGDFGEVFDLARVEQFLNVVGEGEEAGEGGMVPCGSGDGSGAGGAGPSTSRARRSFMATWTL